MKEIEIELIISKFQEASTYLQSDLNIAPDITLLTKLNHLPTEGNYSPFQHNSKILNNLNERQSKFLNLLPSLKFLNKVLKDLQLDYNSISEIPNESNISLPFYSKIKRKYLGYYVMEYHNHHHYDDLYSTKILQNEAAMLCKLKTHSNILDIYGLRAEGDLFGVIVEYAELGTLKEMVATYTIPNELKATFTCEIADVMCYLKSLNIVHANLTTESILVTKEFMIKVTGFGWSHETDKALILNDVGMDLNRARFMSPEIFDVKKKVGVETDIYSLGLVLFSLWSQYLPFDYITSVKAMKEVILNGGKENLSLINNLLIKEIEQCWQFEDKDRISCHQLLLEIETLTSIKVNNPVILESVIKPFKRENKHDWEEAKSGIIDLQNISFYDKSIVCDMGSEVIDECLSEAIQQAIELHQQDNKIQAYETFKQLHDAGDKDAYYYYGYYLYWGIENYLKRDQSLGLIKFELAASFGSLDALNQLGIHYMALAKEGDHAYFKVGFQCFYRASCLGHCKALFHLGNCYLKGKGTVKDVVKGIYYLKKAAELGHSIARASLTKLDISF
ncbi:kinase-like protein [Neoconidiobolus thromboides FSU 785]|nr:kinase-like protein [Neoconidiobolus thromboides FSU 785]